MALRPILTRNEPVLRRKAIKVAKFDQALERLVDDMWETMYHAPGVGLAAPQVGVGLRVLVAEWSEEHDGEELVQRVAFVNPEIIKRSTEEDTGTEGCLSIPGYVGDNIRRARRVTVKGRDPKGREIRVHAEGWFARVLQHEVDHLDGILFTDRLDKPEDLREVSEEEAMAEAEGQPAPGAEAGAHERRVPRQRTANAQQQATAS
ncbi:MAG TPA: peptide deformylase [Ktedonobacterales bacterium]|nr:peptide deformylase [Ktedonobacterales bacterium]